MIVLTLDKVYCHLCLGTYEIEPIVAIHKNDGEVDLEKTQFVMVHEPNQSCKASATVIEKPLEAFLTSI